MGKATGILLAEKGYKVYGTARRPANYANHPFPLIKMDLEDEKSIENAVRHVVELEGLIDVLINNAGRGMMSPLEETPISDLKKIFQTNIFGSVKAIQTALKYMRKQNNGLIIQITSVAGFLGLPFRGGYSASKAAMMIIIESLRYELSGTGIDIIDVCPGDIVTGISENRIYAGLDENSPYFEIFSVMRQKADEEVNQGLPASHVGEKIEKIITAKHRKPRYIVAPFLQRIMPLVKILLPAKVFERLIKNHYKI
jgi:short-subunit dehydrogenase